MSDEPRRATSNMEELPEYIAKTMENKPYVEPSQNITTNTTNINRNIGWKSGFLRGITSPRGSSGIGFVKYVFLLWFVLSIYWFLKNDTVINFSGFLESLGAWNHSVNVSSFFNDLASKIYIGGDWGVFDIFRGFLNLIGKIFGFILGAIGGILDILGFISVLITGSSM